MTFGQKTSKTATHSELVKYNQLMKKLGRPQVTSLKATKGSKRKLARRPVGVSRISTDDQYRKPNLPPTSDNVVHSKGRVDFKLSFDRGEESQSTIDAIAAKAASTAPLYSKGAYQYVTPNTDKTEIGRKM